MFKRWLTAIFVLVSLLVGGANAQDVSLYEPIRLEVANIGHAISPVFSLRSAGESEPAWSIEDNIDNRRYWLKDASLANCNGSNEVIDLPDYDLSGVDLVPRPSSGVLTCVPTNANFNDQATISSAGAAQDGLEDVIGDFTTDEASFWFVGKMDSLDLSIAFELSNNGGGNRGIRRVFNNSNNIESFDVRTVSEVNKGPTWIYPDGTYLSDTHVFVGRYSATEGKIEAYIDGKRFGESYTLTGTKTLNFTINELNLLNYPWGSAEWDGDVADFGVTDDWLTDSEITLITDSLYSKYIGTKPDTFVVIGDSLSAGFLVTGDGWVDSLKTDVAGTHRVKKEAISGMRLDYNTDTTLDILYQDEFENAFSRWAIGTDDKAIIWAGTNDLSDGTSAIDTLANITTLTANLKNDGFEEVYVVTPVDRTGLSSETLALDNIMYLESNPLWDGVVPLRTQTEFDDNTDATHFNADNVHLTNTGQSVAWGYIETVIEGGSLTRNGPPVDNLSTPTPEIWLQPDAGRTVESGRLVQWDNQGSLGGSFSQGSAANAPKVDTAAVNGYDGALFTGTGPDNNRLEGSSEVLSVFNNAPGVTVIAVVDAEDTSSGYFFSTNDRLNLGWATSASNPVLKSVIKRLDSDSGVTTTDTNTVFTDGAAAIVGVRYDYTAGSSNGFGYDRTDVLDAIDLSGLASGAGNSGSDNAPCVHLGRECNSGTSYYNGTIIELKVWDQELSEEDWQAQIVQLEGKYNFAASGAVPSNSVAPVASGTAGTGELLSVTNGTWAANPAPYAYTYQWQRDGVNISGETSSTYTTVAADEGTDVRCVVTATNGYGSTAANSNAISIPASGAGTPEILLSFDNNTCTQDTSCSVANTGSLGGTFASVSSGDSPGDGNDLNALDGLSFDGVNDNIEEASSTIGILNNAAGVTVAFVARCVASQDYLVSIGEHLHVGFNNEGGACEVRVRTRRLTSESYLNFDFPETTITAGVDKVIFVTIDPNADEIKAYINSTLVATRTGMTTTGNYESVNASRVAIGETADGAGQQFAEDAWIIKVWDKVLTSGEVSTESGTLETDYGL